MQLRLMQVNIIKKRKKSFTFEKTYTRTSLDCKLVPVQYHEYENGLLTHRFHVAMHLKYKRIVSFLYVKTVCNLLFFYFIQAIARHKLTKGWFSRLLDARVSF